MSAEVSRSVSLRERCDQLQRALVALGPGQRAELRRLVPEEPGGPTYWRLITGVILPDDAGADSPHRIRQERAWAVVVGCAVLGLDLPAMSLGRALAEAKISELRISRLLDAEGTVLENELRQAARFLAVKGFSARTIDYARLVLHSGEAGVSARRDLARDFYRTIDTTAATQTDTH